MPGQFLKIAGLETRRRRAVLMYRYVYLKESGWWGWEVGGTVVFEAGSGVCGSEPPGLTIGVFIFGENE